MSGWWRGLRDRFGVSLAGLLWVVSAAGAADAPVIVVDAGRLTPERLQVHVGEVVTWRTRGGRPLRLEMDPHPRGHEVAVRAGEVRAYFRTPGEHTYTVTLKNGPGRPLRGTISVQGREAGEGELLTCGPESSGRICIQP